MCRRPRVLGVGGAAVGVSAQSELPAVDDHVARVEKRVKGRRSAGPPPLPAGTIRRMRRGRAMAATSSGRVAVGTMLGAEILGHGLGSSGRRPRAALRLKTAIPVPRLGDVEGEVRAHRAEADQADLGGCPRVVGHGAALSCRDAAKGRGRPGRTPVQRLQIDPARNPVQGMRREGGVR